MDYTNESANGYLGSSSRLIFTLLFLIFSGCRDSSPPGDVSEREREVILSKVKDYLQRDKISYPANRKPIFERSKITYCNLKRFLEERPIFFDGLERGFVDHLRDRPGRLLFVGIPTSSHTGIIVAIDPRRKVPITHGCYFIGE